MDEWESLKT